jgi:hypothetical protein
VNSAPMINRCFRHQHPEAYGAAEVAEPPVPMELRYGQERVPEPSGTGLAEECLGYPDARPLTE